jgi:hypothetical protein
MIGLRNLLGAAALIVVGAMGIPTQSEAKILGGAPVVDSHIISVDWEPNCFNRCTRRCRTARNYCIRNCSRRCPG